MLGGSTVDGTTFSGFGAGEEGALRGVVCWAICGELVCAYAPNVKAADTQNIVAAETRPAKWAGISRAKQGAVGRIDLA